MLSTVIVHQTTVEHLVSSAQLVIIDRNRVLILEHVFHASATTVPLRVILTLENVRIVRTISMVHNVWHVSVDIT